MKTITKKRTAYTIIEILKMFDLAKKDNDNSSKSVKFWDEIEKKNIIPDRTSQSLRTAWRKFSMYGEEQFIKEAMKDPKIRFSHQFEAVPYVHSQTKDSFQPSAVSSPIQSNQEQISQKAVEKPLDMNVISQEPSENEGEDNDMEFLLDVDDLQSV